jgi:hypothetical protein
MDNWLIADFLACQERLVSSGTAQRQALCDRQVLRIREVVRAHADDCALRGTVNSCLNGLIWLYCEGARGLLLFAGLDKHH